MTKTAIETVIKSESIPPYFYDDGGLRIFRKDNINSITTYYVWDSENPTGYPQVVEEIENNLVVRRYGYGLFLETIDIKNGAEFDRFYVVRDGTNSVRMLLDSTGNISAQYDYDAFGSVLSATNTNPITANNPYQFHSEYRDTATNLVYLRARWYDSGNGRFVGMDKYEGAQASPMTLNKYVSFNDDPVNLQDPSGNFVMADVMVANAVRNILVCVQLRVGFIGFWNLYDKEFTESLKNDIANANISQDKKDKINLKEIFLRNYNSESWHILNKEVRTALNIDLPSYEQAVNSPGVWALDSRDFFHRSNLLVDDREIVKFIHSTDGREVVYSKYGNRYYINTNPEKKGTFNFARFSMVRYFENHTLFDVLPYFVQGE